MKIMLVVVAVALALVTTTFAQQDDAIYKPGKDVSLPKLIKEVKPGYTPDALRRRVTGSVILRCVVDRDGVPTSAEIVRPLDEDLDRVSLEALKQWRFEPGKKNGKPVLVQVEVEMSFSTRK